MYTRLLFQRLLGVKESELEHKSQPSSLFHIHKNILLQNKIQSQSIINIQDNMYIQLICACAVTIQCTVYLRSNVILGDQICRYLGNNY